MQEEDDRLVASMCIQGTIRIQRLFHQETAEDAFRHRSYWLAAAILMLSAYVLLTMGRLSARSHLYHWLNILSGAGFVLNSGWNGAYPSASINVVWVAIGLYGLLGHAKPNTGP